MQIRELFNKITSTKENIIKFIILLMVYLLSSIYFLTPLLALGDFLKQYRGGPLPEKPIFTHMYNSPSLILKYLSDNPSKLFSLIKLNLILTIVFIAIVYFIKKAHCNDENNITYLEKNGTHGTANWMHLEEAKEILNVNKEDGIVFGTVNDQKVSLPIKTYKFNKNVAIFGAPGTGKSRSYVRPNVFQLVKEKQSMILTDPKGELFRDCYLFLKSYGYDVKTFNLVNMLNSDRWNPLAEVHDDLSAQMFTDIVIANTTPPGSKGSGDFWEKGEQNLLKALVLYVIYEKEEEERNLKNLYSILSGKNAKEMDTMFGLLNKEHPAKAPYNIFCQSSEQVRTGIIIGLGTRLQVFQNKIVQALTETSDIDLAKPGKAPCAYFCITSDMNSTFDFLSGLFFSFLFNNLINYADWHDGQCDPNVYCILDEFPNIASIPDFTKKISTMRSRGVHCHVIFQNIGQLQNRYPDNGWSEIIGCCDSKLFLGCTDLLTANFVSEMLGVTTVEDISHSKQAGLEGMFDFGKDTKKATKRNLLNPDEVLKFDSKKAMLMMKGQKPIILDKGDYSTYPMSKEMKPIQIKDYTPQWGIDLINEIQEKEAVVQPISEEELVEKRIEENKQNIKEKIDIYNTYVDPPKTSPYKSSNNKPKETNKPKNTGKPKEASKPKENNRPKNTSKTKKNQQQNQQQIDMNSFFQFDKEDE